MKKNKRIFLVIIITLLIIFGSISGIGFNNINYANTEEDMTNISQCSKKFMDKYFKELKAIKESDNKDKILIVTSKTKIKNGEGASKIIEAPNNQYILQYDSYEEKNEALENLKTDNNIVSVEENIIYTKTESEYNSWGIEKIGLDLAKQAVDTKELNDITVAIIDTGCDMNLFNKNYPGKIVETYNVLNPEDKMVDEDGHGTHIAGTIAEGTPSNVKILPIKVSTDGNMYNTDIIEAINYIVYNNKADVINMSFGSYYRSESIYQAINAANQKNIICVAAAGNDNTSSKHYPSAYDNTMSIAACDSNLKKASFSNFGSTITFTAPGVDILSINGTMSGTSMATPHAVCATAILKSYNNNYTLEDTINIFKKYAIDLGNVGRDNYFGHGLINFLGVTYCDCKCENCDTIYCPACDCAECIFEEGISNIKKIEVITPLVTTYNYGSITNLSTTQVRIYYDDEKYFTRYLLELDGCEILGYDPYCYTNQTITIKYKGVETTFDILREEAYESGWEYEVIDESKKEIKLTKYKTGIYGNGKSLSKIYVPQIIDGYDVKSLGEKLFSQANLEEVILPETVTDIGKQAFYNSGLKKIDIKSEGISIGDYAFKGLEYLEKINSDIEYIGNYAFENCVMLKEVTLSEKLETIGDCAFGGCTNLENITIPKSVKSIGNSAFYNTNIKNISIPNGVTKIGKNTFTGCINLESIVIPESITEIGERAFSGCSNLKSINIPKNVENIGKFAFQECGGLEYITVDNENKKYDSRENCNALIETETNILLKGTSNTLIPNTVKAIGQFAFAYNKNIELSIIPEGIEEIQGYAFYSCENLKRITIPKSVNVIGEYVFTGIKNKDELTILVYKDSYAKEYAKENSFNYLCIDEKIAFVNVYLRVIEYFAFQQVNLNNLEILIQYNDGKKEYIKDGFTIEYENGNDSFRYGDTYFIIKANSLTGNYIEEKVVVEVSKAIPEYEEPTNLKAIVGQTLSDIELPEGFEWMDPTYKIQEEDWGRGGIFKARYIPNDTDNYQIIEDISILVNISKIQAYFITLPKKTEYKAFETVNVDEIKIQIQYTGLTEDKYITEGIKIRYTGENTSFRYGDTHYIIYAYSDIGEYIESNPIEVTVTKAIPEYTVPTNVTAKLGQKLSEIKLPEGFEWMDPTQVVQETGNITFCAKYVPADAINYETIENIEITINVNNRIPFNDVSKNSWYYNSVVYVFENNMILGTSDTTFNPNGDLTRGMLVTILWRMEGSSKATSNQFTDVGASQYYYNAVNWAASKKIISGYGNGKFGPNDKITREQLAVILRNYAQFKKKDVSARTDLSEFTDSKYISSYAKDAVSWAVTNKIIRGKSEGTRVDPHGKATRAETATMLYNYCMNIK